MKEQEQKQNGSRKQEKSPEKKEKIKYSRPEVLVFPRNIGVGMPPPPPDYDNLQRMLRGLPPLPPR